MVIVPMQCQSYFVRLALSDQCLENTYFDTRRSCSTATRAHDGSCFPACSRTMYSAYQSGQFASCWPVRFSCSPCAAAARRSAVASSVDEVNVVSSKVDTSGQSHGDLLEQPAISVGIAERGERAVAAMLWIQTANPSRPNIQSTFRNFGSEAKLRYGTITIMRSRL